MLLSYTIKIFFSTFEFFSGTILALSLFRIPFKYHLAKLVCVSFVISALGYYLRDWAELTNISALSMIMTGTILIMIFLSLPFFYSMLVSIVGFALGGLAEFTVIFLSIRLGLVQTESLKTDLIAFSILLSITGIFLLLITWFLQRNKLGFLFISRRFAIRNSLKPYNMLIAMGALLVLIIIQITNVVASGNNYHYYILLLMSFVLFVFIIISYRQNRKSLDERYSNEVINNEFHR